MELFNGYNIVQGVYIEHLKLTSEHFPRVEPIFITRMKKVLKISPLLVKFKNTAKTKKNLNFCRLV